jgi:hypothetical protein
MKKIIIIILVFVCIAQSACVTTLQPLVTYDKIITDNRIIGKWKNDEQQIDVQLFSKSDFYKRHKDDFEKELKGKERTDKTMRDSVVYSKSYNIQYVKDGVQYDLLGGLIRINGQLFMDFTPINSAPVNNDLSKDISMDPGSSLNANTIAKVEIQSPNTLKIDFIDGGFIYDQVKAGHLKIKNERDELYDTFLITASSIELQKFLEKYGKDKRFYNKENSVTLIRKN